MVIPKLYKICKYLWKNIDSSSAGWVEGDNITSTALCLLAFLLVLLAQFVPSRSQHSFLLLLGHRFLYLLGHESKELLDIVPCFGTCLEKSNSQFSCQSLAFFFCDSAVVDVGLVAHQDLEDVVGSVEFDLFDPIFDVHEGVSFADGVGEYDAHGASIVGLRDSFELFLSGCVPDLQSDFIFSYQDGLGLEVDADGGEMGGHKVVITEFKKHIGFANSAIANDKQLDERIVTLLSIHADYFKDRDLITKPSCSIIKKDKNI